MRDLYLEAMLKGEGPKKPEKGRFEIALDKSIKEYLDTLSFGEEEPGQLISPQAKRKKYEEELKEALTHSDLNAYLLTALQVIKGEGRQYWDSQAYSAIIEEFANAEKILASLNLEEPPEEDLGKILHLSNETIHHIFDLAVAKYNEERYPDSVALFVLLTVLQPKGFDLWYRTGIAAQSSENYTLAINSYATAASFNPDLIEAHLFSVECYLKQGMTAEAKVAYEKAENLHKTLPQSDEQDTLLEYANQLLKE